MIKTGPRPDSVHAALRFVSLKDVAAHVAGLTGAQGLRTSGRWTTGQIFHHLAAAFETSIEPQRPSIRKPPRLLKLPIRWFVLNRGLPRGVGIPQQVEDRLTPPPDADHDREHARLLRAIEAFERASGEPPVHPVLGALTWNEWMRFHLRHCELHLSHITRL